jgi:hypothetical protein
MREVIGFHGDFGPNDVVNAKGVSYNHLLGRLIVSLSPFFQSSGMVQILNAVDPAAGTRARFAAGLRKLDRAIESKLITVGPDGVPVSAGFVPGDSFVPVTGGQIAKVDAQGAVIADPWVIVNDNAGFWGDLAFDHYGSFGGALLLLSLSGHVYSVTPAGKVATVLDFGDITIDGAPPPAGWGNHPEGLAVAPASFGPYAGQLVVGIEGASDADPFKGCVYVVDRQARATLIVKLSTSAEDIEVVPANSGTYYQCEIDFNRGVDLNRLLVVTSAQFLARRGHLLVVNELAGELSDVTWTGAGFAATVAAKAPGRWLTTGFSNQNEELEAGCFAAAAPSVPVFSAFSPVPGAFSTARSVAVSYQADRHLLAVIGAADGHHPSFEAGELYLAGYDPATGQWLPPGWARVSPESLPVTHAPSAAVFGGDLHLFAIRAADGRVVSTLPSRPSTGWTPLPGGLVTDQDLSATVTDEALVLCARRASDALLYLNHQGPGGRWAGWSLVPDSGVTAGAAQLAWFQDDLYVFGRGRDGTVLASAFVGDGRWTAWAEIPGRGHTASQLAATVASDGQLHLFAKDATPAGNVRLNLASITGTWQAAWIPLPARLGPAPAATAGRQVYVAIVAPDHTPHLAHSVP